MNVPTLLLPLLALAYAAPAMASPTDFPEPETIAPKTWVLLGPFPSPTLAQPVGPEGVTRAGFDKDYLAFLGGEAAAKLRVGMNVAAPEGGPKPVTVAVAPGAQGFVDMKAAFPVSDQMVGYAYGVLESDKDQTLTVQFGSDDGAIVWVNGKQVHRIWTAGRSALPANEQFPIQLRKGANDVLVKVDNGSGDWSFYFAALTEQGRQASELRQLVRQLAEVEIVPQNWRTNLLMGSFPALKWGIGGLVKPLLESDAMKVVWYGPDATVVAAPTKPGRYAAYVQATTAFGMPYRRLVPFYMPDPAGKDWMKDSFPAKAWRGTLSFDPDLGVSRAQWNARMPEISAAIAERVGSDMFDTPEGASNLAYLLEPTAGKTTVPGFGPDMDTLDYLIKVKRSVYGCAAGPFQQNRKAAKPAPVLRAGTPAEAHMKSDVVAKLDKLCQEWSKAEGKPFTVFLARNGVVFMQKGYGTIYNRKTRPDERFYPASIGKMLTGVMLGQFIDQGLLSLDDPVGRFLPDFPTEGPKAVTFRNCVTHTSGIVGHGTFNGLLNPTLDNDFATLILPGVKPGTVHQYGGDGNNLTAKAMELIAGKSFLRLLQESVFRPLGAGINQRDLGWITNATPMDVAKVGQLFLNGGSYGDHCFFSPATFKKLLPVRLGDTMPNLGSPDIEWGAAMVWVYDSDPKTPNPYTKATSILGPRVIGHGSASSSVMRVDLDHGFVVVMGRYGIGNNDAYGKYLAAFMQTLKDNIAD